MISVHHLNESPSQRVLWLLKEIGAPYEIGLYQRNATTRLASRNRKLKALHPLGKSIASAFAQAPNSSIAH